jgi:hypothetical protein
VKRCLVVLSLVLVLAAPAFAYQTPKKPPTFVEEPVPDGKALIYIYFPSGLGTPLFFTNSGPLATLTPGSYFTYVVDPGTVKLWVSYINAKSVAVSAVAGQAYYVRFGIGLSMTPTNPSLFLEVVKAERAKTNEEILFCEKIAQ